MLSDRDRLTITIEVVSIAKTLPTLNPATHTKSTNVGSSPDILINCLARTP